MEKARNLVKRHALQGLTSALLIALVGIYCHALYEQKDIEKRLRANELSCGANDAAISGMRRTLDDRTDMLHRELDQRTEAMQTELRSMSTQFQTQIQSLERLITTLAGVLKRNGIYTKEVEKWDIQQ